MEEIDLKELLNLFLEKKVIIIFITLLFMIAGIIYTTFFIVPMYTSYTTLVLVSANTNSTVTEQIEQITTTDITINSKLVSTYNELIKSSNVIRQVISNLKLKDDEIDLKENISVSSVNDTEVIKITVTHKVAKTAAKIANEIVTVFTDLVKETYKIENVKVIDIAEADNIPSNINHLKDIIVFMVIGIIISIFYILFINMLDTTVKTAEGIEKEFKVHVLASIPKYDIDAM